MDAKPNSSGLRAGIPEEVALHAATDLREVVDRLAMFRRQLAVPDIDAEIEAIANFERASLLKLSGLTSAANSSVLLAVGPGQNPASLCATSVRALEMAAAGAFYGGDGQAQGWSSTAQRIVSMLRPSLSVDWVDALDQTPAEAPDADHWR